MSNPNPPAAGPAPRLLFWIGCIALALYATFLARNSSNVAGGADSSGYLNSARLLAAGQLTTKLRTPPEFGPQENLRRHQFQPHGFAPFPGIRGLSPTYAVGLPLHLALAGKLFGWERAPVFVGVGSAVAAVLLCFALARRLGLDRVLSATSAILLAAYPIFLFTSIQPLSDTLATTWCLAAVFAALRAREHAAWAVACGAAFAIAVLVRATNALLLPTLIVLLGLNLRHLGLVVLGGLPGALWLGFYNHTLYGGALRSGYVEIAAAFRWDYGAPTLVHFAKWLGLMLPAIVLGLPFAAFARRDPHTRILLALALWFGAFTGLYIFYEVSHEVWWDLRFILPGTPALILGAMLGVDALAQRRPAATARRFRFIVASALSIWSVGLGWFWTTKLHLLLTKTYEQGYADATAAALTHFPTNALVLAAQHSGALYYYTPFFVLRWDLVDTTDFEAFRTRAENAGRPICALLFNMEEREALEQKCPGDWMKLATINNTTLWQLTPSRSNAVAK
jgi:hypothetical protein